MGFGQLPRDAQVRFEEATARIEQDPGLDEGRKAAAQAILAAAAGEVEKDSRKAEKLLQVADAAVSFLKDPIGIAGKLLGI